MHQNNNKVELPEKQQNFRATYLALCFLTLFLSYGNLQNLFSNLCEQYGYKNLGQTAILTIYFAACCSTPLTSLIIKKLGYKIALFLCSIGYILFESSGLIMVFSGSQNPILPYICVCIGAYACGFSSSILWVSQGGYISQISSQNNKSKLFALFFSIIIANQIIGNFIGTFMLGKVNIQVYFIVLALLACNLLFILATSSIMFLFLPSVEIKNDIKEITLKSQLIKIRDIIGNKKLKYLIIHFIFPGLSMAFYSGYSYKIVRLSVPQQQNEILTDYRRRLNVNQSLIFIGLGIAQAITGILYRKYSQNMNKFRLATIGYIMVQISGILSFLSYLQRSYFMCFISVSLWGCCQIFNQTNTSVIVSILFGQKVEGFTVSRIFYCIGITSFLLVNILMSQIDISTFLTIFIIVQTFATAISMNLKYLQSSNNSPSKPQTK